MDAPRKNLFTLTQAAGERIKLLLASRGKDSAGIRVGVRTKGCNGLAYTLEFVDEPVPGDECVMDQGVTIYIDPKAVLFVVGTQMDFVEGELESGFLFRNPNEKGRCGCGESFHV